MRAQRPDWVTAAIDATSDDLPSDDEISDDDSFDASMATVTVHQCPDRSAGLTQMRRVTRGPFVIMTFGPVPPAQWWVQDYGPEVLEVDARRMPAISDLIAELGGAAEVIPVPVPADCLDGFGQAFFARPERLLVPEVRRPYQGGASCPKTRSDDSFATSRVTSKAVPGMPAAVNSAASPSSMRGSCSWSVAPERGVAVRYRQPVGPAEPAR